MQRRLAVRAQSPDERAAAVMAAHGRTLLRVAHHWSLCHDDALDAYQRALEIFLRRVDSVDPATEAAWLKVVVKHEALAIRRARQESVTGDEVDLDARAPAEQRSVEEQIAGGERVSRSAEALRALKPDEARALMLKAQGLSYSEIGERCGWTYTKVNRAITEGRRRFMDAYAAIESGDECQRFAPVLAALAAGTATSAQIVEIRPHLRHCTACRATVRELHISLLKRVKLLLPPFLLGGRRGEPDLAEKLLGDGGELVMPSSGPWPGFRDHLGQWFQRFSSSDLATGIQIASGSGGGRLASLAAVIGFCVSGLGAATVCVVSGVVQNPLAPAKPAVRAEVVRPRPKPAAPAVVVTSVRAAETPTPTATATPPPRRRAASDPSQKRTPEAHRNAPISPVAKAAAAGFAFERSAAEPDPDPAPPPATGGQEFTP
jgi:RNA polymerase sigma factor (sigma-70 family)